MSRVVVALMKNGDQKIPKFSDCIVEYFKSKADSVTVNYKLENNLLILSETQHGFQLLHSTECPTRVLSRKEDYVVHEKHGNISVAVSMVVESADNYILLTRRPAHMRSSPRVWVPPGGHLELGETLWEGGLREVKEETGLDLSDGKLSVLCLWENVYPLLLGLGTPKSHVLVVYVHAISNKTHEELRTKMVPDPEEVAAYCWLSLNTIADLYSYNYTGSREKQYVLENGDIVEKELDTKTMFFRQLFESGKLYSGVQCALKTWLLKSIGHKMTSKI